MKLVIEIDDAEYRTLCTGMWDYANKADHFAMVAAQKGAVGPNGKELTIDDFRKAKDVSERAFGLKGKIISAMARFRWPGTQCSMVSV